MLAGGRKEKIKIRKLRTVRTGLQIKSAVKCEMVDVEHFQSVPVEVCGGAGGVWVEGKPTHERETEASHVQN